MDPRNPLAPGGAAIPAPSSDASASPAGAAAPELPEVVSGTNPLVTAANPLLNIIPQLRASAQVPDPARLRNQLVAEIQAFEQRAAAAGIPQETIIGARYCLCTALDETAAQTPWGGSGVWSRHGLLVTFHNETWGGEKFFQLLARLAQNPQQHGQLLELMYFCLALGFEGRFRIIDNGRTQLETLKQRLAQIVRQNRGDHERPLALHWKGIAAPVKRGWELLPLGVVAALSVLLGVGLYLWFAFSLASLSDNVFATIASVRAPRIVVAAKPPAAVPRLAKFLEPEIREGLVAVRDDADRSTVTLRGDGLFDPGSTSVRERYVPVITRIANALNEVAGPVLVTGHTDSTPIRTVRFPSNWNLSQERADVVRIMLAGRLANPARVRAEGRAETEPVAANDTPENKARNRRVEVVLQVAPSERDADLQTSAGGGSPLPATTPATATQPPPGPAKR
jgi:type VI secretion system protein ImpK